MKSVPDKQIKGNEENLSNEFEYPPYELYDMPYREVINEIAKSYPYCIYFFLWRVYCNDNDRKFTFPYSITAQSWNKFQTKLTKTERLWYYKYNNNITSLLRLMINLIPIDLFINQLIKQM